jgi:hypothetical protein
MIWPSRSALTGLGSVFVFTVGAAAQAIPGGGPGYIRGTVRSSGQPVVGARVICNPNGTALHKVVERTQNDGAFRCSVPARHSYVVTVDNGLSHVPQSVEVESSLDNLNFLLMSVQMASATDLSKSYAATRPVSQAAWVNTLENFDRFTLKADTAAVLPLIVASSRPAAEASCRAARNTEDPVLIEAWCNRVFIPHFDGRNVVVAARFHQVRADF